MINVAELMTDRDFTTTIKVRRPKGQFQDEGQYRMTYEDEELTAIVQPASDALLQMMPEGSRLNEMIEVWCRCLLRVADGAKVESDVLVHCGKNYRVVKAEPWGQNGYYRVVAEGFTP